jgi:uncharacterized protein YbjT (DUF2867 family)
MAKTAIVIGATGLVGAELVRQLLDSPDYERVITLVRRALPLEHPKLQQEIFDFDHPDVAKVKGDDLYCAMGTTLARAGSKEAQYKIDCTYPYEVGKIARSNGAQRYLLVSSIGANAQSGNFYLRTKGDLEEKIAGLGFDAFVSARPSFLLGDRQEFRLGEKIGIVLTEAFRFLIPKKYRGIQAAQVAAALIAWANRDFTGIEYLESDALQDYQAELR